MFLGIVKAPMGAMRKLQLVAVSDIGWFAARALESPESHGDRKIAIAGDELSLAEILAVYKRVVGKAPAVAPLC